VGDSGALRHSKGDSGWHGGLGAAPARVTARGRGMREPSQVPLAADSCPQTGGDSVQRIFGFISISPARGGWGHQGPLLLPPPPGSAASLRTAPRPHCQIPVFALTASMPTLLDLPVPQSPHLDMEDHTQVSPIKKDLLRIN
jgi:hypothetical protein